MIGMREGWPGAADAYQYLSTNVGTDGVSMAADLAKRSGWAIAYDENAVARLTPTRPQ